jgi:uncharacterized membrane protein (DUF485 family)
MTADHVLAGFVAFILLVLAGVLAWIRRAQQHFDRLDRERHG